MHYKCPELSSSVHWRTGRWLFRQTCGVLGVNFKDLAWFWVEHETCFLLPQSTFIKLYISYFLSCHYWCKNFRIYYMIPKSPRDRESIWLRQIGSKSSWSQYLTMAMCSSKLSAKQASVLQEARGKELRSTLTNNIDNILLMITYDRKFHPHWSFSFKSFKLVSTFQTGILIHIVMQWCSFNPRCKQCSSVSFSKNSCMRRPSTLVGQ